MTKDYYQTLGLDRGASADEVKKAYRKLSKELHPDKNMGDDNAEERFKEVNEAYEVLGDPQKKQMYDQFGTTGGPGMGGGAEGFSGFTNGNFSGFADIFENFFGGGGGGRGKPSKQGEDIEIQITINFQDAVTGADQELSINKMVNCTDCDGAGTAKGSKMIKCIECDGTGQVTRQQQSLFGTIAQRFVCPTCNGSGEVPEEACKSCGSEGRREEKANVNVHIPAGIHHGQTLRVSGEGNAGRQGSASGDLYLHIALHPDKRFIRDGDDISGEITIPVIDAILGMQINIETVHGSVELKIPEGTQPEQIFRLKNKGMPIAGSSRHGNHYVQVHTEIPKKLNRDERKLLEKWRAS